MTETRLKTLLKERTINAAAFARKLGMMPVTFYNYIHGNPIPSDRLYDICKELDVSADWILGLSEERKIK